MKNLIYFSEATAAELEDFESNPKTNIELRFKSVRELDEYEAQSRLNEEKRRGTATHSK